MVTIQDKGAVLSYRFVSTAGPLLGMLGAAFALLALFAGDGSAIAAIFCFLFFLWVASMFTERVDLQFDANTGDLRGCRRRMRTNEPLSLRLEDIDGIAVEKIWGPPSARRVLIISAEKIIPLTTEFSSDRSAYDHATKIHAWLKRNNFEVPLTMDWEAPV